MALNFSASKCRRFSITAFQEKERKSFKSAKRVGGGRVHAMSAQRARTSYTTVRGACILQHGGNSQTNSPDDDHTSVATCTKGVLVGWPLLAELRPSWKMRCSGTGTAIRHTGNARRERIDGSGNARTAARDGGSANAAAWLIRTLTAIDRHTTRNSA